MSFLQKRKRRYIATLSPTTKLFERVVDRYLALSKPFGPCSYDFTLYLPQNPNITLGIVKKYETMAEWNWCLLSMNCSLEEILTNPTEPWERHFLSNHPEITVGFMEEFDKLVPPNEKEQWYDYYLADKDIPIDVAVNHPKYKWREHMVKYNKNITLEFVKCNLAGTLVSKEDNDWYLRDIMLKFSPPLDDPLCNPMFLGNDAGAILSRNANLTAAFVSEHMALNWNWAWILECTRDIENIMRICPDLLDNPNSNHWNILSSNENITMDIVTAHKNARWNKYALTCQPQIIAAILRGESPPDLLEHWNWGFISYRVKIEDVLRLPHYPWNWRTLSSSPNMTMEIIEGHPALPWHDRSILNNPNVTWPIIERITDAIEKNCRNDEGVCIKLMWQDLIQNHFLFDDTAYGHAISRDIQLRQRNLAPALLDCGVPRDFAAVIARYIDYC